MKIALSLLVGALCVVGCSSSGSDGGSSGSSGSTGSTNPAHVTTNPITGGVSGDLTGTFNGTSLAVTNPGGGSQSVIELHTANDGRDLTDGLTLTAPAGTEILLVSASLGFNVASPASGSTYTEASPEVCNGFAISLKTGAQFKYLAPKGCDGSTNTPAGTLNVHFDSVSPGQSDPGFAPSFHASGTLKMHLDPVQATGAGVDLSVTF